MTLRQHHIDDQVLDTAERLQFYGEAAKDNFAPLWKILAAAVPKQPAPAAVPHIWRYQQARKRLIDSCDIVTAAEAERRVLVLENPGLTGQSRISDSLFCGLQIINPGEFAPAHRHAASALRFIVEGSKAYTTIEGERTVMHPGDLILTPSWTWHDHGNLGDDPMIWIDGLDLHFVNLMATGFREESDAVSQTRARPDDCSQAEFGQAMAPLGGGPARSNPMVSYPYARTREALASMESWRQPDPHIGHALKYLNPSNGDWAFPTLAPQIRLLPAGFETSAYRSTDATVFVGVEGEGTSEINGTTFSWEPGDIFVAPSWAVQRHRASKRSVLFSFSDRSVQEKLGLWRESRTA